VNHTCEKRRIRLTTMVSAPAEKKAVLAPIRSMREWVLEVEPICDGSWAAQAEEISPAAVGQRLDACLSRLATFLHADGRTADEPLRLGHLLKALTHLRPGLLQCSDVAGFPRTHTDRERTRRAVKMHARRISGRKNWTS
jgi:hypothetical protein